MASREWCTLNDRIIKLVRENETQSQEYQFYLETFGRDKLEAIWKEHVRKLQSAKNWHEDHDADEDWTLFSQQELMKLDHALVQEYGGSLPDGSRYLRLRSA